MVFGINLNKPNTNGIQSEPNQRRYSFIIETIFYKPKYRKTKIRTEYLYKLATTTNMCKIVKKNLTNMLLEVKYSEID